MDRIDAMRTFVRIVDQRSFSGAARDLSLSRSAITKAIQQLEAHLGARLLERTTKKVTPTPEGQAYYEGCIVALSAIDDADASVGRTETRGLVRVSIPDGFVETGLLEGLCRFLEDHPALSLHFLHGAAVSGAAPADCTVAMPDTAADASAGQAVGSIDRATVAAPAYLRARGEPIDPSELGGHRLLARVSDTTGRAVPFEFGGPRPTTVAATDASVGAALHSELIAMAVAGLGIAQVPRAMAATALAEGALVEVLDETPPPPLPLTIVETHGRHLSPQARVFMTWAASITGIVD